MNYLLVQSLNIINNFNFCFFKNAGNFWYFLKGIESIQNLRRKK